MRDSCGKNQNIGGSCHEKSATFRHHKIGSKRRIDALPQWLETKRSLMSAISPQEK